MTSARGERSFDDVDERDENPVKARARVVRYGSMLIEAELDLKRARHAELEAEKAYRRAYAAAMLSGEAPTVERGGATVADKQAWVEVKTDGPKWEWEGAKVQRQAAWDHYQRVDKQAGLAQSILKSIDSAFAWGTGREQQDPSRVR